MSFGRSGRQTTGHHRVPSTPRSDFILCRAGPASPGGSSCSPGHAPGLSLWPLEVGFCSFQNQPPLFCFPMLT